MATRANHIEERVTVATRFVFHMCPPDLRDNTLYPLSELRARHPDLYQRELEKWSGRESVLDFEVPHLGGLWGEALNLSALNPQRLVEMRRQIGASTSRLLERRLVRIPIERLAGLDAVWYASSSHWINSRPGERSTPLTPPPADFSPFDRHRYRELGTVPDDHRRYVQSQHEQGLPALGFVFVPHVLVRGSIDLAGLEVEQLAAAMPPSD